jgi:hypothetical protein
VLSGNRFASRYAFSSTFRLLDGLAADQADGDVLGHLPLEHTGEHVAAHDRAALTGGRLHVNRSLRYG